MRTLARRLGAVAVRPLLVSGLAVSLVAGSALVAPVEAAPSPSSRSASGWLADQLTGGLVHNDQFGGFDDYGLTVDVFVALNALGTETAAQTSILDALAPVTEAYVGDGSVESYAGALGKLATAVELGGRDPRAFGAVTPNLVDRLQARIHAAADAQQGRGVDASAFGDFSNTIGQAWIVRALVGASSGLADESVAFLLQQQCADGYFRVTLEPTTDASSFTCDDAAAGDGDASIDATALATDALVVARDAGVTGLDDDIDSAADWLVSTQRKDGSFVDQGTANANSTGLAAATLTSLGRTVPAANAAGWLLDRQVRSSARGPLRREIGAIAFDSAALAAGRTDGITPELRDQWRRASAQAAVGLDGLLPPATLVARAPDGFRHGGAQVTLRASGLEAGERFTIRVGSVRERSGLAGPAGNGTVQVRLPKASHRYVVRVTGSRPSRTGTDTLRVLGAKVLTERLRSHKVRKGGVQRVRVRGLAVHEPVRLVYRGRLIWEGTASATGRVAHSFHVGQKAGRKKLVVRGAFADRRGVTHFRVRR